MWTTRTFKAKHRTVHCVVEKRKRERKYSVGERSVCITWSDENTQQLRIYAMLIAMTTCALVWFECDFFSFILCATHMGPPHAHIYFYQFTKNSYMVDGANQHRQCALPSALALVLSLWFSSSQCCDSLAAATHAWRMANGEWRMPEY